MVGAPKTGKAKAQAALDNLVYDTAKSELFKEVMFISNKDRLMYATTVVW